MLSNINDPEVNAGRARLSRPYQKSGVALGLRRDAEDISDRSSQNKSTASCPNNSSADTKRNIPVQPGNRIPDVPQHSVKMRLQYDFREHATLGANAMYGSSVYARGDGNNQGANGRVPATLVMLPASLVPILALKSFNCLMKMGG